MRFFHLINTFTHVLIVTTAVTFWFAKGAIAWIYSEDEDVKILATKLLLILACFFFFDGINALLNGPIRSLGLEKKLIYWAIGSYYAIVLPLALKLVYHFDLGVVGLQSSLAKASMF